MSFENLRSASTVPRFLLATLAAAFAMGAAATPAGAAIDPPVSVESCSYIPPERDLSVTKIVYEVGKSRGVSEKVMLAAFEAGWIESNMNNLNCGDLDSLGVFQQRPSQNWGTPEQIRDVRYAATKFFERAQTLEPLFPGLSAGLLADEVQNSCCPYKYDQAETKARSLLDEVKRLLPNL
ncbi:hypothetical protein ACFFTO_45145, partial [Amycolatopsis plumensis]